MAMNIANMTIGISSSSSGDGDYRCISLSANKQKTLQTSIFTIYTDEITIHFNEITTTFFISFKV